MPEITGYEVVKDQPCHACGGLITSFGWELETKGGPPIILCGPCHRKLESGEEVEIKGWSIDN